MVLRLGMSSLVRCIQTLIVIDFEQLRKNFVDRLETDSLIHACCHYSFCNFEIANEHVKIEISGAAKVRANFSAIPNEVECRAGLMTAQGALQMFDLGQFLRSKYAIIVNGELDLLRFSPLL